MVIVRDISGRRKRRAGALTTELVIAMAILVGVMLPLAFSFAKEQKLCRAYYYHAVAMQLVDGEMEALAAGEWLAYPAGEHVYTPRGEAVRSLPPGRFVLRIDPEKIQLEWVPAKRGKGGRVAREVAIRPPKCEDPI